MPRVSWLQSNFTAGEITPKLNGRVDIGRYQNACKALENAHVVTHGGAVRSDGTRFIAEAKNHDKKARLIPFVFSRSQSYMLELGDGYMRVFRNRAQVLSGGAAYEIVTPYTEAQLPEVNYTQGADTMFLAHPSIAIQRLRRFGHAYWDMSAAPFIVTPFAEIGFRPATTLTLSSAAVGAGRTFTAGAATFLASDVGREITSEAGLAVITGFTSTTVVTCEIKIVFPSTSIASGAWTVEGSPQTECTPTHKDPVGKITTLTLAANGWRSDDVGKWVEINGGLLQITAFTSATAVDARIEKVLGSTTGIPAGGWTLNASVWNSTFGFPRAVTLYQQRLLAAGSDFFPQTIWGSRIAEYLDFTLGLADDDGFAFPIGSDQFNPITHLTQTKQLVALTFGGEFAIKGGEEKAITPTNVQITSESNAGCNNVRPVRIGNELFFIQRFARKLMAMGYRFDEDTFKAVDLTLLSEHITESGIADMSYQQEPDSLLWCVRSDGQLASLTVDRDQEVLGWGRKVTDGVIESIATIPTATGDETWMIVRRTINGATKRYIEILDSSLNTDCAITGTHATGAKTWSGLTHLEGKTVDVVADGYDMGQKVVSGGKITIDRSALAVEIGLPYKTKIQLLKPEVPTQSGTSVGNAISVSQVVLRVLNTIGGKINGQVIPWRAGQVFHDTPVPPFTGDKDLTQLGWNRSGDEDLIEQDRPFDFHLQAVMRKVTVND